MKLLKRIKFKLSSKKSVNEEIAAMGKGKKCRIRH